MAVIMLHADIIIYADIHQQGPIRNGYRSPKSCGVDQLK